MLKVGVYLLLLAISDFQASQCTSIFGRSRIDNRKILPNGYAGVRGEGDIDLGPVTGFTCPNDEKVSANPDRCDQYFTCYYGEPVHLWQCFSDYLFDINYYGCNFPQNVNCGDRPKPDGTATTLSSTASTATVMESTPPVSTTTIRNPTVSDCIGCQQDFQCPFPTGFFPVPGTCGSDYFLCASGVPTLQTCPNNNIFDPVTLECVAEADATCKNFQCPGANGFYPITSDACCQTYFICVSGVANLDKCPGTSFFEPTNLNCEVNAPCLGTPTTTSPTTTSPTTTSSPITDSTTEITSTTTSSTNPDTTTRTSTTTNICYPYPNGFYPYPGDCTKYYECSNGVPYPFDCPGDLVFNPDTEECDYLFNVPSCQNPKRAKKF